MSAPVEEITIDQYSGSARISVVNVGLQDTLAIEVDTLGGNQAFKDILADKNYLIYVRATNASRGPAPGNAKRAFDVDLVSGSTYNFKFEKKSNETKLYLYAAPE